MFFFLDTPHWDNVDFMEPITVLSAVEQVAVHLRAVLHAPKNLTDIGEGIRSDSPA
jgi:hypothetical protein